MSVAFVDVAWRWRTVRIEHQWICAERTSEPLVVFLHEGLGSVSMWKDWPEALCKALGCRGLVYSRPGYGRSTPRPSDERWGVDFMHQQAHEVLPALLQALGINAARDKLWLLGHSDGGSIALLHAAQRANNVAAAVVLAPHFMVEELALASIEKARQAYLTTDLRQRLARHHDDPDSAFWGWNQIWLDPSFKSWSIEEEISSITCPLLAVQGLDDEYGTLSQIRGIAQRVPQTRLLELPHCRHSPHIDQGPALIEAVVDFFQAA